VTNREGQTVTWGPVIVTVTGAATGPRAVLPSATAGHADLVAVDATGRLLRYPWVSDGTFGVPQPVADGFTDVTSLVAGHFTGPAGAVQLLAVRKDGSAHLYAFDATGKAVDQGAVSGPLWNTFTRLTAGVFTKGGQEQLVGIDAAGHAQLITLSGPPAGTLVAPANPAAPATPPATPATPAPPTAATTPTGALPGAATTSVPGSGLPTPLSRAGAHPVVAPAAAVKVQPAITAAVQGLPQSPVLAGAVTIEAVPGTGGIDNLVAADGTGTMVAYTFTGAQGFVPVRGLPGAPAAHLPATAAMPVAGAFAGTDQEILVTGPDGQTWIMSLTHPERPAQGAAFASDAVLPTTQPAQGQHRLGETAD
jgi:hypothetical protein